MADTLVNQGRATIVAALRAYASIPKNIGIGTGTQGTPATATDLATPSAEARTAGTDSTQTVTTTNDTFQVQGTVTATGARAVTEAGLFTHISNANTIYIYSSFSVVNLATNDIIDLTWKQTFS